MFSYLTDMLEGFRDNNVYRLEQPRLPEDKHPEPTILDQAQPKNDN